MSQADKTDRDREAGSQDRLTNRDRQADVTVQQTAMQKDMADSQTQTYL